MNIGDDSSDSSSMPALVRRKLMAKRSPSLASSQPSFSLSTGVAATLRNRHCCVANTTMARTSWPRSIVNQLCSHSSWKASSSLSRFGQREVICASARSEDRSFAPSEFTRTKISVTSS